MDLLILGGTRFLGREIARQAVGRGHRVSCLARGQSGPPAPGTRLLVGDRQDRGAYDKARKQPWDAVEEACAAALGERLLIAAPA
jgi:2'-hydroxyisoflavone reductase